jgi:AcrR family transcriptional regulator
MTSEQAATGTTTRPTRREERRMQTLHEIKQLAMDQIAAGGPDAVSLSGIVRQMSMSPAALYRYFANRDALLADLVVDAYDQLADHLAALDSGRGSAADHLDAVLRGTRHWALEHPNAYRLVFQTSIGSGQEVAPERTIPAASRSMSVIINALVAAVADNDPASSTGQPGLSDETRDAIRTWARRTGHEDQDVEVLMLALRTWTRLHGIISLELGGHLDATGIGAVVLFEAEVDAIRSQAASLPPAASRLSAADR